VRITTIGRGNVGGGLGELWREAGHEVVEMGREEADEALRRARAEESRAPTLDRPPPLRKPYCAPRAQALSS